jgi:N-methylhydantoinase A/oxoprolinase/acetone carboxylase beta subunit
MGSVEAYSFTRGEWLSFQVLEREALAVGAELKGPVIVLEDTATTCVDAGYVGRVDESSCLFLRRSG